MEIEIVPKTEQTVRINLNYFEKIVYVYSNRKAVINRLLKKLGEPDEVYKTNKGGIFAVVYKLNFDDTRLKKVLSITILLAATRYYKEEK